MEKKKAMKRVLSCLVIIAILMSAMQVFIPEVCAMLRPYAYMGTVVSKDIPTETITIQTEYEYGGTGPTPEWTPYSCTLEGVSPNGAALSEINVGDYVEAHSLGAPDGGWFTLAKLKSSTEKVITDIYGNPADSKSELLGNYKIDHKNTPDCSACSGCNCQAEYSDVTIIKGGSQVDTHQLYPSQSYVYEGDTYRIDIAFHSGQAPAYPECTDEPWVGPQGVSDFTIHIKKIEETKCGEILRWESGYTNEYCPPQIIKADMWFQSLCTGGYDFKGVIIVKSQSSDDDIYTGSRTKWVPNCPNPNGEFSGNDALEVLVPEDAAPGDYDIKLQLWNVDIGSDGLLCDEIEWEEGQFKISEPCEGTDTSCGCRPDCKNCNDHDGWHCQFEVTDLNSNVPPPPEFSIRELRDYYCSGSSCAYDVTSSENCNDYDCWMDTGNTEWVDVNECREKEQREQEYWDHYCYGGACTYSVTDTQWIDTGNTRNAPDGTICDCTARNTLKRCDGGVCTDTGICDWSICGADAACDGKEPGDSCGGGICNSNCECVPSLGQDIAYFHDGAWCVSTNGDNIPDYCFWYGFPGDIPVVGDINQDGFDDIAYFHDGAWCVSTNGDNIPDYCFWFGFSGDIPVVGDINQDGFDDIAYVHNGAWCVSTNGDNIPDYCFWFGFLGDMPVVGDINQDGFDDIAYVHNGAWYVSTNGDNIAEYSFWYGFAGDIPVVGNIG